MRLRAIFDEAFAVLAAADIGLTVPRNEVGVHTEPPSPYLSLPEVTYGEAGRGLDRLTDLALIVIVGPANNPETFDLALEFASSGGPKSIPVLLQEHTWTSCGTLFVRSAEPSIETERGNNPALAYTFHLDVTGRPG